MIALKDNDSFLNWSSIIVSILFFISGGVGGIFLTRFMMLRSDSSNQNVMGVFAYPIGFFLCGLLCYIIGGFFCLFLDAVLNLVSGRN